MSESIEQAVRDRYSKAAGDREEALCCPVNYDASYLKVLPQAILERDYGCGDPSQYVKPGETVLDLGSGAGKICYIASQVVGPTGAVIGLDMNDEMLELAEQHREAVGNKIGYHNVAFKKGKIQDMALDVGAMEAWLHDHPIRSLESLEALEHWQDRQRRESPLIAEGSIDVIVSNCVLNLVSPGAKRQLFNEMFRVLKLSGRAVISDIVSDESISEELQADPELWSGCISGAFREDEFLAAFEAAGFHGIRILKRDATPWRVVEGIEFRSVTVEAFKGKQGPCLDRNQAVIYNGPWKSVTDDDGHTLFRGQRMAVCDKTFRLYSREPYGDQVTAIQPAVEIPLAEAREFDCRLDAVRSAESSKGAIHSSDAKPGGNCC